IIGTLSDFILLAFFAFNLTLPPCKHTKVLSSKIGCIQEVSGLILISSILGRVIFLFLLWVF
ncbi:hypothetical protein ACM13D_001818, partial [Campylobacter jejuni]